MTARLAPAEPAQEVRFGLVIDRLCALLTQWAERRGGNPIAALLVLAVTQWLLRWKLRLLAAARVPGTGPKLRGATTERVTLGGASCPESAGPALPGPLRRALAGLSRIGVLGREAEALLAEPDAQALLRRTPELARIFSAPPPSGEAEQPYAPPAAAPAPHDDPHPTAPEPQPNIALPAASGGAARGRPAARQLTRDRFHWLGVTPGRDRPPSRPPPRA